MGNAVGYRYAPMNSDVPPDVKELVRAGKTLEAMKRYREATGASVEQAKSVLLSL
jgi:ribosomal protein L7/L12